MFIVIVIIIIIFNIISHRAEILVSLVFAVRADINQMSKVSQQFPFWVLKKYLSDYASYS